MALYDGNQLPENPTSTFQLLVSLLYALMMTFYMSLGGFAAWATNKQLAHSPCDKACEGCTTIGQLQHPTHYASDLVHKHNAITRGLLAFIPAVFSLAHLYTSSLHSSTLYSAGNVIFAALLGYSAFFMGKTLHQLVGDADRMDTTKAVYESLYMFASTYDRLCRHDPPNKPDGIFYEMEQARTPDEAAGRKPSSPAWQSPWVLLNNFLAVAAQDDARVWAMFSAWMCRFQMSNLTMGLPSTDTMRREVWDFLVWPAWLKALLPEWARHTCDDARHKVWLTNVGLAYWLYSQNKTVRTITGSMVVQQGIMDEMLLAGCRSHQLFYTASGYLRTLSDHVVKNLRAVAEEKHVVFMTKTGRKLHLKVLSIYFDRIFHEEQAQKLSMACERYICRLTPAFGFLCLPTESLVPQLSDCWKFLFPGTPLPASKLLDKDPGYWCRLWLAYMHVVLLGADLLRMHNNKQYFKEAQSEAGALKILRAATPVEKRQIEELQQHHQQEPHDTSAGVLVSAVDAVAEAVRADVSIEFSTLHDLSDGDLYALAAFVATLLLRHRMREEWGQDPVTGAAVQPKPAQVAPFEAKKENKENNETPPPEGHNLPKNDDVHDDTKNEQDQNNIAGLQNETDENNCFINALVQCLRSCSAFMEKVRPEGSAQHSNRVVQELLRLLADMEKAELNWQTGHTRPMVDPTELRKALDASTTFKFREMGVPAELLRAVYTCFRDDTTANEVQPEARQVKGTYGGIIDSVFGLRVSEKADCRKCRRQIPLAPASYEHVIGVRSEELATAVSGGVTPGMGGLLRSVFDQQQVWCDGCGQPNARHLTLDKGPKVLVLELGYANLAAEDIRWTLSHVEEELDITHIYHNVQVEKNSTIFKLTSAVAYCGLHYVAFVFYPQLQEWLQFDDAIVRDEGTWQGVISKCVAGKLRPTLLFYTLGATQAPPPAKAEDLKQSGSSASGGSAAAAAGMATPTRVSGSGGSSGGISTDHSGSSGKAATVPQPLVDPPLPSAEVGGGSSPTAAPTAAVAAAAAAAAALPASASPVAAAAAAAAQLATNPDAGMPLELPAAVLPGAEEAPRAQVVKLCDIETYRDKLSSGPSRAGEPKTYGDYLCSRGDLVRTHSSLPAIVEGVECLSASDWCLDVMRPLLTWLVLSGLTAAVVATIACSQGVFLVTVSGAVQALAAWALMLHMDHLPTRCDLAGTILGPPWFVFRVLQWLCLFVLWLCELLLRPVWLAVQVLCFLLMPNWRLFWVMEGFRVCGKLCFEAVATGMHECGMHKPLEWVRKLLHVAEGDETLPVTVPHDSSACSTSAVSAIVLHVWPAWMLIITMGCVAECVWLLWIPLLPHSMWWPGFLAVQWSCLAVLPFAVLCIWLTGCPDNSITLQLLEARKFAVGLACICCLAVTGASVAVWWFALHRSVYVGQDSWAWQVAVSLVVLFLSAAFIVLFELLVLGILSVIGCLLQFVWLRVIEHTWWWLQEKMPPLLGSAKPPVATETAAAALAAAVTVAATAKQAAAAAQEAILAPPEDLKPPADPVQEVLLVVEDVEKDAIIHSTLLCGAVTAATLAAKGISTGNLKKLKEAFEHLEGMRAIATQRLLLLSCEGISLLSCFEQERRHFYKDRIKPWNVAVNIISPVFFYTFLVLLLLALWQEPWYARRGMCLGRCGNGTSDCMADQNIGLGWFDNAAGAPLGLSHLVTSVTDPASIKPPECPGTGSFVQGDRGNGGCQCPWMSQVLDVTVLPPVAFAASANSTLCRAEVRLVNPVTGEAPKKGTAVPAVWHSMTGGKNDNSSVQLGEKMVALTNSLGYAVFTSPVSKPFNRGGGHGCNLTVLASEVTSFVAHDPTGSGLYNFTQWL